MAEVQPNNQITSALRELYQLFPWCRAAFNGQVIVAFEHPDTEKPDQVQGIQIYWMGPGPDLLRTTNVERCVALVKYL